MQGKYPWEEKILPDDPNTIVDRLNGVYNQGAITCGKYTTPPIQQEAAREIERLHAYLEQMGVTVL